MKSYSQKAQVSLFMRIAFSAGGHTANISPKIQTNQCARTFVNGGSFNNLNSPETDN
ncbi:MAG: hypothetical protein ABSG99_05010 [Sedimentisphaerales bacterium]